MDNTDVKNKPTHKVKRRVRTVNGKKEVTVSAREKTPRKTRKKIRVQGKKSPSIGDVQVEQMRPFIPMMKELLGQKGIATSKMSLPVMVVTFYNEYVSKKAVPSNTQDEPIDVSAFVNDAAFRTPVEMAEEYNNLALTDVVGWAVNRSVTLIKRAKAKKQAAKAGGVDPKQALAKEEQIMAAAEEKVRKELERKAAEEKAVQSGKMKKYIIYAVIAGVILIAAFLIFKKK